MSLLSDRVDANPEMLQKYTESIKKRNENIKKKRKQTERKKTTIFLKEQPNTILVVPNGVHPKEPATAHKPYQGQRAPSNTCVSSEPNQQNHEQSKTFPTNMKPKKIRGPRPRYKKRVLQVPPEPEEVIYRENNHIPVIDLSHSDKEPEITSITQLLNTPVEPTSLAVEISNRRISSESNDSLYENFSLSRRYKPNVHTNNLKDAKEAMKKIPNLNFLLTQKPKSFDNDFVNVEITELDVIKQLYSPDSHRMKPRKKGKKFSIGSDPVLNEFARKVIKIKTVLESEQSTKKRYSLLDQIKTTFISTLQVDERQLKAMNHKKEYKDLPYLKQLEYWNRCLVAMFTCYANFILPLHDVHGLNSESKQILLRRSAFIHALLLLAYRYSHDHNACTMPNGFRMPVDFFKALFKDKVQVDQSLVFIKRWKYLINDDYTVFALTSLLIYFDVSAPVEPDERFYIEKCYKKYFKILEWYCVVVKTNPLIFINIMFNLDSIKKKRLHSGQFIKRFNDHTAWQSDLAMEMNKLYFQHV